MYNKYINRLNKISINVHKHSIFADIDDCENDPCENGGTCVDAFSGFVCDCAEGYEGATCQYSMSNCKSLLM